MTNTAPIADTVAIMKAVRLTVARRKAAGDYSRYDMRGVRVHALASSLDGGELLVHLLNTMKKSWELEIGDFPIKNRGGIKGTIEVFVKKAVWKLLKFYTYRMFTQQREFNIQIVIALTGMARRLDRLEALIPAAPAGGAQ